MTLLRWYAHEDCLVLDGADEMSFQAYWISGRTDRVSYDADCMSDGSESISNEADWFRIDLTGHVGHTAHIIIVLACASRA